MEKTFDYTALYEKVSRSLSIIGKRSTDDNGNRLFEDITLGSREKGIISDYFRQAVIDIAAEMEAFVTGETDTAITITLPSNHNEALNTFIGNSCDEYCVSYALYSWFTVTAPRLSEKYLGDMKRQLSAVVRLIHQKNAPKNTTSNPLDISTSVS